MNNYDKFMWWSIQNYVNFHLVVKWYNLRRLPLERRLCDGKRTDIYNIVKKNNGNIKKWIYKNHGEW